MGICRKYVCGVIFYGILAQYAFQCILADKQCSKSNQEKTGDACDGLRQCIDQQLSDRILLLPETATGRSHSSTIKR